MFEPTKVCLPGSILYPVEVTGIVEGTGTAVRKQQTILRYKYWKTEALNKEDGEGDANGAGANQDDGDHQFIKEYHSTFESPIDGDIVEWNVTVGDTIGDHSQPVVTILEKCTHSVQYGGLCAICGQSVADQQDYSEFSNRDRAPIAMSHDTSGLKVSYNEAERIEKSATAGLLNQRKLILVVDLDQTIIHAAVEPTIGEWMADPNSPNHAAVANVKTFTLEEEVPLSPRHEGPRPPPSLCRYYVKLRPGLDRFLKAMNEMYEMHIYTMATKAYAKAIAALIDPEGEYFGDRILSRDESGSVVQKSLKRLFPVSTSMVAIIDDRGDVWRWKPNLIKVLPYNFFVGIGDINSSFLPQRNGAAVLKSMKKKLDAPAAIESGGGQPVAEALASDSGDSGSAVPANDKSDEPASAAKQAVGGNEGNEVNEVNEVNEQTKDKVKDEQNDKMAVDGTQKVDVDVDGQDGADKAEETKDKTTNDDDEAEERAEEMAATMAAMDESPELLEVQATQRSALIEQQQHDRPLAKLQQELGKSDHVLHDDDRELENLQAALTRVHDEFFRELEAMRKDPAYHAKRRTSSSAAHSAARSRSHSVATGPGPMGPETGAAGDSGESSSGSKSDKHGPRMDDVRIPDVAEIISHMRQKVFEGCVFLLSGWLPRGTNLDTADIVVWMRSFGAVVVAELVPSVTHVVATNGGTEKVRLAAGYGNIKIVYTDWVYACIAAWQRVPEDDYYIDVPNAIPHANNPKALSGAVSGGDDNGDDDVAVEESETPAPENVARFVRSLSHGDVWAEVDKELEEFMGSEDDSSDDNDDDDDEDEANNAADGDSNARKRSRSPTPSGDEPEGGKRARHNDDDDDDDDDNDFDDDKFAEQLENDLL